MIVLARRFGIIGFLATVNHDDTKTASREALFPHILLGVLTVFITSQLALQSPIYWIG